MCIEILEHNYHLSFSRLASSALNLPMERRAMSTCQKVDRRRIPLYSILSHLQLLIYIPKEGICTIATSRLSLTVYFLLAPLVWFNYGILGLVW